MNMTTKQERRMTRSYVNSLAASVLFCSVMNVVLLQGPASALAETAVVLPAPVVTEPEMTQATLERAVLAGGCFWGVQAVFQHVKGVKSAVSGYAGGTRDKARYEVVSTGETGHAEAVEITFDPKVVTYGKLLQVFFSVAHNPTELNRKGPDAGSQYRSTIFADSDAQQKVAEAYIRQLDKAGLYHAPIVTTIERAKTFYPAEAYHQDYATRHPDNGYIAIYDLPKIRNLNRLFPNLYRPEAKLVADGVD
jgi:peptide-methionine (S)-S-oxide reductase